MKIRNGFVSNSSASSFVVALNKKPSSVKELKQILFGDDEKYSYPFEDQNHADYEDEIWGTMNVASIVFNDMKKKATKKEIFEVIRNGWFNDYPEFDYYAYSAIKEEEKDPEKALKLQQEFIKKLELETDKAAKKIMDRFLETHSEKVFYIVSYSDNDGELMCAMEHGNLFNRVPHLTISYH